MSQNWLWSWMSKIWAQSRLFCDPALVNSKFTSSLNCFPNWNTKSPSLICSSNKISLWLFSRLTRAFSAKTRPSSKGETTNWVWYWPITTVQETIRFSTCLFLSLKIFSPWRGICSVLISLLPFVCAFQTLRWIWTAANTHCNVAITVNFMWRPITRCP